MRILFVPLMALLFANPANAARFSGGMCASEGTWLQTALKQSRLIMDALETLRNDPNCKLLVGALENAPKINAATQSVQGDSESSFANSYRELSALDDYMNPSRLGNGVDNKKFQDAVFNVVFNKSYESLKDLNNSADVKNFSDSQRESIRNVSVRLKNFIDHAQEVANLTMATSKSILDVLPQSKLCLDSKNKAAAAAAIFGAIAHTSAALVSGGQVNGVGSFTASLLNYSREMSYVKSLQPLQYEEYKNSVSCLVESTSESYCSIQDAEDSLEALKKAGGGARAQTLKQILANSDHDPIASPLAGLVIYMRDVPVVQAWLQKVLFGMSPRTSWQGTGKNDNWSAYLGFIQSVNSLQANFRDKEELYISSTSGKDRLTKIGQVREIFDDTLDVLRGRGNRNGSSVNFYERTMQDEQLPFFLLGIEMPPDFNLQINNIDTLWLKWARDGSNGFDNPDHLLQAVKDNLWKLMDKAQVEANALFASRMIVDPQNLVTEAMRGPGVSAYQAFIDQRAYYAHLADKLAKSAIEMEGDPSQAMRRDLIKSHIPLLRDSISRLDRVIVALRSVGDVTETPNTTAAAQSEKIMDVIYSAANMLVSWDSFFGTRMQTALQADLSDTLWRKSSISDTEREYLLSVGPEIVGKLSGFFSTDPVSERTDLNSAKVANIANLKAVEAQFAKVLFNEVVDIDCKLEGGYACDAHSLGQAYDPAGGSIEQGRIKVLNEGIVNYRSGKNLLGGVIRWLYPESEDSKALVQVKAKYCVQALAFESRDSFREICKGAVMESDFADSGDSVGLNMSFDSQLAQIGQISQQAAGTEKFDRARGVGVCSLRSYLRKNHVYFMYRDYNAGNN
ncbi:MAG: hypothetical protein ACXVCK_08100 [Bdellovibrionota bacterium]